MTALQDASLLQLERMRRAWHGSALPGFLRWWAGELATLVPARWRASFAGGQRWYIVERQGEAWVLRRVGETAPLCAAPDDLLPETAAATLAQALAEADPADRRIALVLPAERVLRRRLVLPAAARDNLRQVVGYDIDRQTPFRADDIHYGVRQLDGSPGEGRVAVELAATPRATLDPWLDALSTLGIRPDRVDVADHAGLGGVDLLPPARRPRRADRQRLLNIGLAVLIVILAITGMALWVHNRAVALDTMRAEVEALRGDAQQVKALRQRLTESAGASGFLVRHRLESPTVLPVLAELTTRLPDDTWLERFTLNANGQIGFQGQSPQAARLIDALKGATHISEPSFQGTIQTDPTSGKERFYMQAKAITPRGAAAPGKAPARADNRRPAAGSSS